MDSARTTVTDFDRFPGPDGAEWFVVTTAVDDPEYLARAVCHDVALPPRDGRRQVEPAAVQVYIEGRVKFLRWTCLQDLLEHHLGGVIVRMALVVSMATACTVAALAQSGEKKPNIAITGCLLSQGYATFILDNARVDATGDEAAAAVPTGKSAGGRPANEPAKWVLDEPGNIRSHLGEQVQVLGVTDWKRDDPAPIGPGTSTPHVTVITVKYVSPSCS